MTKKPNIIYMHSHDTGRYIQPYGHAIPTPNLQKLAEEGVLFRQAFCVAPTCSPSRASLLTGQYPHSNGMTGLAHRGFSLNDHNDHIVHTLRKAGYISVLAGMQHVSRNADEIGYDGILSGGANSADQRAKNFIENADPDQPFFLDIGFSLTHRTKSRPGIDRYFCGNDSPIGDARYVRPPAPLPDTPKTRQDMADFIESARRLDEKYGVILDALSQNNLAENTLVIVTTDHGLAFPAMKCNLTDHGTGVLLIMRGPDGFNDGKVIDAIISQIDIFPTICELIGVEIPEKVEGRSIMPLIRGDVDEINDEVFAEINYHVPYEPSRSVRTKRWKYIRRFDDRGRVSLPNCDDSVTKTLWMDNGWRDIPYREEELYDLLFDPNETANLIDQPHAQSALSEMRDRLDRWMRKTDDPLLHGDVSLPEGAKINEPDGVSPDEPPIT